MKRSLSLHGLAILAFAAAALPMYADGPPTAPTHRGGGRGLWHLNQCLSSLDLSSDQQATIQAIVSGAKSTFQADGQALKADHQKLESDITNGADKSVVGQDTLTQHADAAKLRSDGQAVRDQVLAKLSTDQQNKLTGCLQAFPHRFGHKSSASGSSSSGS